MQNNIYKQVESLGALSFDDITDAVMLPAPPRQKWSGQALVDYMASAEVENAVKRLLEISYQAKGE